MHLIQMNEYTLLLMATNTSIKTVAMFLRWTLAGPRQQNQLSFSDQAKTNLKKGDQKKILSDNSAKSLN